jgi:hypothetical protein
VEQLLRAKLMHAAGLAVFKFSAMGQAQTTDTTPRIPALEDIACGSKLRTIAQIRIKK